MDMNNGCGGNGSRPLGRREFLRAGSLLGAGLALGPLWAARAWASPDKATNRAQRVEATRFLMGTFVSVAAVAPSRDQAREAVEAAFAEVARLCSILSRHDPASELSHLNRFGSLAGASPELPAVVVQALNMHHLTGGVFDPTIAPVVDLLRRSGSQDPDRAELRRALDLVGADKVRTKGNDLALAKPGMALTLDGVGKGWVVDRASEAMARLGVPDHLINAGGDILASGRPGPERGWHVALEDPTGQGKAPSVIELANMAVATSGAYEQTWGPRRHHIVRPENGLCPGQDLSVSVVAPTAAEADALATALFASAPSEALRLVDSLPGRACLVLGRSGAVARSRRWAGLEIQG